MGGYTNFPNGITSFGVPVLGNIGGVPYTGNYYFVWPGVGADGNNGKSPSQALSTLPHALDLATAGKNDVIVLIGDGTNSARLSAQLDWNKNSTHLIGVCAPTNIAQRARITTASGATSNIANLFKVSASNCTFANFSFFQGVGQASTDEQLAQVTGQRNYFANIAFGGMGSANGAARAGSYCLQLSGGSENTFDNCTIGLDTISRSAANASLSLRNAATRNTFRDCLFPMLASAATPLFVDANASASIDRYALFTRCKFLNAINSTGTSTTSVVAFNAAQGGTIVIDECSAVGSADWAASATATVQVLGSSPNGHTSGIAVASATA